ncbi:hypothetical protein RCL1_006152 [Eukaryota sp. TZLM3-RCL]
MHLFQHIPPYEHKCSLKLLSSLCSESCTTDLDIHPSLIRLAMQTVNRVLRRGRERTVALIQCLYDIAQTLQPDDSNFLVLFSASVKLTERVLTACRPLAPSQTATLHFIRTKISSLADTVLDASSLQFDDQFLQTYPDFPHNVSNYYRMEVLNFLTHFRDVRIYGASKIIGHDFLSPRIRNGDVILTFGASASVGEALEVAARAGVVFRVIVVDSRPDGDGATAVERLTHLGVDVSFALVTGLSYVLADVSTVILGCSGMLSNGAALGLCGTGTVALMATSMKIPVIMVCETYRFLLNSQLDALSWNELGNPADLMVKEIPTSITSSRPFSKDQAVDLSGWRDNPNLDLLNLVYDVTPIDCVSMVITEMGCIPATSVPQIIREVMDSISAK